MKRNVPNQLFYKKNICDGISKGIGTIGRDRPLDHPHCTNRKLLDALLVLTFVFKVVGIFFFVDARFIVRLFKC
jgi:hypothetical protein